MKTRSLTGVLTGSVLLANLVCLICFSAVATHHEMHGRRRAFDIALRGRTDSLLAAMQEESSHGSNVSLDAGDFEPSAGDAYEVLTSSGSVVKRSPRRAAGLLAALSAAAQSGYFNFKWNGEGYRALSINSDRVTGNSPPERAMQPQPLTIVYASPTSDLRHEATEAAQYYAVVSALLLAAIAVALVWFLRRRLSPLRALAESASRVSTDSWEFAVPEEVFRTRELQPIAASIHKLLGGLERAFERQRQFTGDAAHELKTSIAVLKSGLQLLSMRQRTVQQYEEGLARLVLDIERMEGLTEQMLTLARVEEEPLKSAQATDLASVIRFTAECLRYVADAREITVCVCAENSHFVAMQRKDAEILISNLMMNALQHSPARSMLMISVQCQKGSEGLSVADCGPGISEAALPHIFERFYRADESRSRQSGGAGLGLAICKAIVERSRGNIKVASELGKGTEVIVSLPPACGAAPSGCLKQPL